MYKIIAFISYLLREYYIESVGSGLPIVWQFVADTVFFAFVFFLVGQLFSNWPSFGKSLMFLLLYWGYSFLVNMIKHDFFSFWTIPQVALLCFTIWFPFKLKYGVNIFYSDYN
jgi:hypothetical protein